MRFEDNNTNNIELISAAIDNYVNLQRIKATNTCKNPELDYQLELRFHIFQGESVRKSL